MNGIKFQVRAADKSRPAQTLAIKEAGEEFFDGETREIQNPNTGQTFQGTVQEGKITFPRGTAGLKPGDTVTVF